MESNIHGNLTCVYFSHPQFNCVDPTGGTEDWVEVQAAASAFNQILLSGNCPAGSTVRGLRYAWRQFPCEFKKCAVYSRAESFPAPPFIRVL